MTWAVNQKCGSAASKLVLLMLANHCNGHTGQCNPRHKTLAEECEMRVETLKTHLKHLESLDLVTIVPQFSEGVQLPNQYIVNFGGVGVKNTPPLTRNLTRNLIRKINTPPYPQRRKRRGQAGQRQQPSLWRHG